MGFAIAAALWAGPAEAVVFTTVPDLGKPIGVGGLGTRVDFTLLDPLPPNTKINLPKFNQYETLTFIWDGSARKLVANDATNFVFNTLILSQTETSFSILYWYPGDYSDCNPGSTVGEVCSVLHDASANSSWPPVSTLDSSFPSGPVLRYDVNVSPASPPGPVPEPATWGLMLIGVGLAGTGIRRALRLAQQKASGKVIAVTYRTDH